MAGPLVFWPNRKSGIGLRQCSKVPRSFGRVFATKPPIAEDPMTQLLRQSHEGKEPSEILREAAARLGPHVVEYYDAMVRALADAKEQLISLGETFDKNKADIAEWYRVLNETKRKVDATERENAALREENEAKTADLRRLQKEVDPDEIRLRIMYAVDEALAEKNKELAEARALLAERDAEIAELKRSKKRLREALDRLSRDT